MVEKTLEQILRSLGSIVCEETREVRDKATELVIATLNCVKRDCFGRLADVWAC